MGLGSSEVQLYVGSFWQGILAIGTYLPWFQNNSRNFVPGMSTKSLPAVFS
jgi:hypothetical protein